MDWKYSSNNLVYSLDMPIKFTIDETQLAGAICSLKASIKGRRLTTIKLTHEDKAQA